MLVTGEIVYEKEPNGEKFVSVPHILAKNISRLKNDNKSDDIEQLAEGIFNILLNIINLIMYID